MRSSSPRRTASSSAVHSTSSSRDSGKSRAFGTPPTWWLARPARCRNVAIERGEPSWHTRSTSPMSMPSSSDAVATSTLSSPRFSRCSAVQAQLLRHAAVVRHHVLGAEELGQVARRALGHAPRVDEHERRAVLLREVREALVDLLPHLGGHHRLERRRGHLERQVALADVAGVDDVARRPGVPSASDARQEARDRRRSASAWPTGRCARAAPAVSAARRSSESARWLPRLLRRARGSRRRSPCASWTSIARPDAEPSSTYSDSGVVTTMCGGRLRMLARSACGVSPVRTSVRMSTSGMALVAQRLPDAGQRRGEVLAHVVRQRLQRRDVDDGRLVGQRRLDTPCRTSPSIAARNAASVLPDPVGAATSTFRPAWRRGHARACGAVGASKCASNQRRRRDGRRTCRSSSRGYASAAACEAARAKPAPLVLK